MTNFYIIRFIISIEKFVSNKKVFSVLYTCEHSVIAI
jgi:hypothetical protein